MNSKCYYINKNTMKGDIVYIDFDRLKGYDVRPRNRVKYDGIVVNKLIVVKPTFIEKLLKRKIKRKLNLYFNLIVNVIDGADDDPDSTNDTLREALNDLTRYKNIVDYKYRRYLDDKYISLLLKKIEILEYELKSKIVLTYNYDNEVKDYVDEEEYTPRRHR